MNEAAWNASLPARRSKQGVLGVMIVIGNERTSFVYNEEEWLNEVPHNTVRFC